METEQQKITRLEASNLELQHACIAAFRVLDSVAFVSKEGDTDKVLEQIAEAVTKARGHRA